MKRCLWAFVIGGLFCVVGQLGMFGWEAILPAESTLVSPLTMVFMAAVGLICYLTHLNEKLEAKAVMGVCFPISGMVGAVSAAARGGSLGRGSFGKGWTVGAKLPPIVLGSGSIFTLIVSAIAFFTHADLAIAAPDVVYPWYVRILLAFVIGGIFSILCQLAMDCLHLNVPKVLILGVCLGAFFGLFGLSSHPLFDNAGFICGIAGAGAAIFETSQVWFYGITAVAFWTVIGVYVLIDLTGILGGYISYKTFPKPPIPQDRRQQD